MKVLAPPHRHSQQTWVLALIATAAFYSSLPGCYASQAPVAEAENAAAHHRCAGTTGQWCSDFLKQTPIKWKVPPRISGKACPKDCSGVGSCLADTGLCSCPAGWGGEDCSERDKRPCTNAWRDHAGIAEPRSSTSLSDIGWTASRCAGICDEDTGMCHCNGTMGRVPAPAGAPPGTPALREGRPMLLQSCAPKVDDYGAPSYGTVEPDLLYGPTGWCEADGVTVQPSFKCPCVLDGMTGPLCELKTEQFCVNQCSGHGDCLRGWCKCHQGYFGHDCANLKHGSPPTPELWRSRPALQDYTATPSAEEPPPAPTRLRPLIYIYDTPPIYNSRMLQYRSGKDACTHRAFHLKPDGSPEFNTFTGFTYAIETGLHEMLAQSPHRTLDPLEADFFYVPVYASCFAWPIYGWADTPWFYGIGGKRTAHMSHMLLGAKRWVEQTHPYWNKTGGKDHIFLASHDEGSCWVPEELRVVAEVSTSPWNHILGKGVPCYDPKKDLVIPALRPPVYLRSPLVGSAPLKRDTLLFFRGDFRNPHEPGYSRGIRQELRRLARTNDWAAKYNIRVGDGKEVPGEYSQLLASSKFCLVAPGDGYSSRAADSILNGCIPVVVMDEVDAVFETILDWELFSIRVPENQLAWIPEILVNVSQSKLLQMQHALSHVWHRFAYTSSPVYQQALQPVIEGNRGNRGRHGGQPASLPAAQHSDLQVDDAFDTIIAWLHSKIPAPGVSR